MILSSALFIICRDSHSTVQVYCPLLCLSNTCFVHHAICRKEKNRAMMRKKIGGGGGGGEKTGMESKIIKGGRRREGGKVQLPTRCSTSILNLCV